MADHDAAAVVGQIAGLGTDSPNPDPVTPEQLVERFCGNSARGLVGEPGTTEHGGHKVSRGWCGYNGQRSIDPVEAGFDDGYDFMGALGERGWMPMPAKGDWPLVVYMYWKDLDAGQFAIAQYCEADLTVWEFDKNSDAKAHYESLKDCP